MFFIVDNGIFYIGVWELVVGCGLISIADIDRFIKHF